MPARNTVTNGPETIATPPSKRRRRRARTLGTRSGGPATGVGAQTSSTVSHLTTQTAFAKMDSLTAYTRGRIHGIVDEYCVLGNVSFSQGWKNLGF